MAPQRTVWKAMNHSIIRGAEAMLDANPDARTGVRCVRHQHHLRQAGCASQVRL